MYKAHLILDPSFVEKHDLRNTLISTVSEILLSLLEKSFLENKRILWSYHFCDEAIPTTLRAKVNLKEPRSKDFRQFISTVFSDDFCKIVRTTQHNFQTIFNHISIIARDSDWNKSTDIDDIDSISPDLGVSDPNYIYIISLLSSNPNEFLEQIEVLGSSARNSSTDDIRRHDSNTMAKNYINQLAASGAVRLTWINFQPEDTTDSKLYISTTSVFDERGMHIKNNEDSCLNSIINSSVTIMLRFGERQFEYSFSCNLHSGFILPDNPELTLTGFCDRTKLKELKLLFTDTLLLRSLDANLVGQLPPLFGYLSQKNLCGVASDKNGESFIIIPVESKGEKSLFLLAKYVFEKSIFSKSKFYDLKIPLRYLSDAGRLSETTQIGLKQFCHAVRIATSTLEKKPAFKEELSDDQEEHINRPCPNFQSNFQSLYSEFVFSPKKDIWSFITHLRLLPTSQLDSWLLTPGQILSKYDDEHQSAENPQVNLKYREIQFQTIIRLFLLKTEPHIFAASCSHILEQIFELLDLLAFHQMENRFLPKFIDEIIFPEFRNQLPDIVDAISERFCFKSVSNASFHPEKFLGESKSLSKLSNHSKHNETNISNPKMQRILRKTINSLRPMKPDASDYALQFPTSSTHEERVSDTPTEQMISFPVGSFTPRKLNVENGIVMVRESPAVNPSQNPSTLLDGTSKKASSQGNKKRRLFGQ